MDTEGTDGSILLYQGGGLCLARIGTTVAEGAYLTVESDARLDGTTTGTDLVVAVAMQAGVDGDFIIVKNPDFLLSFLEQMLYPISFFIIFP